MKFSVCIINWNWLEILKLSIEKLRKEKETVDLEIIVLDNGSVDGSADWLNEQKDVVSICNEINLGSAIGRNQMIRVAKGDYILMLDSDILYINGSLEYLEERFDQLGDEVKCIGFNPKFFTNDLESYSDKLPELNSTLINHSTSSIRYALTQYGLFKKDMFEKCMFDENYKAGWGWEDDDLFLQMRNLNWDVCQTDCLYYHAKFNDKWNKTHKIGMINYNERGIYFNKKWGR